MKRTRNPQNRWLGLAVLVIPVLIISMDATVLGFAIPAISEALEPTSSQLLWIIDIYSFVLAGLLVTMGVLGDRIGRRKLLMIGALAFSAASLLAGYSTSAEMLIFSRALLGVAGATLMPSTLSIIRNLFTDARERQTAIAVWATAFAVGAAIGPIVGGFLLEHYWWGSVFIVGVPFTAALLVLAPKLVPESKDPAPAKFDPASAALSMTTMLPIVYAIKMFSEHGWHAPSAAAVVIGATSGVLFVRRQLRAEVPMIDVRLFRIPHFRMAVTGNLVACFGFAGSMFIVTQYLQLVVGMSPLRAGLQLLPGVAASVTSTLLAPVVARRIGPFAVIAGGLALAAVGFGILSQLTADSVALVTVAVIILNSGLGAAMTVAIDGILASVAPDRAGAGAAVSETANELGIALGTAVLGSVISNVYRSGVDELTAIPTEALHFARETLGAAVLTADYLPEPIAETLRSGAGNAFVDGASVAAMLAAGALLITAVWAAVRARGGPDSAPVGSH